jgi:two-component system CheB/CheR fusion protein
VSHARPDDPAPGGLEAGIRGAVRKALRDGRRTVVAAHGCAAADAWHRVEVTAEPLGGAPELQGLLLLSFADEPPATEPAAAQPGSVAEHDEPILRQLEDELETVREDLQGSLQDLQASNQELRVANEEVMSVNEEMRASNEELETSKEELQSLNEELTTVNDTLSDRVVELQQAHNDLDNLLTSSNVATVILDTTFHVRRFTPAATRLFDLTAADVGRPIGNVRARGQRSGPPARRRGRAREPSPDQRRGPGRRRLVVRASGAALSHARRPHRGGRDHVSRTSRPRRCRSAALCRSDRGHRPRAARRAWTRT